MKNLRIVIKKPSDCSPEELQSFESLVRLSGQVWTDGLMDRIKSCVLLGFCYKDSELVSISAIKSKNAEYVRKQIFKTTSDYSGIISSLELGYCFTAEQHRGSGYNSKLNDALLERLNGESVFATTGNLAMQHYFESRGFDKIGKPYPGKYNSQLVLYIKQL